MINTFGAETIFRDFRWSIGSVLLGTQGMSSLEHKECLASNTRNVLLGTHGMFCFDHKECPASNIRNVLLRTQRMFCFEHKECSVSNTRECSVSNTRNVLLRTHGMFCFEHNECLTVDSNTYLTVRFQWCPSPRNKIKIINGNFYFREVAELRYGLGIGEFVNDERLPTTNIRRR